MELILRFSVGLLKVVSWFLGPIFWMASLGNRKKVPPMSNSLLFLSATCLAEKIRKREIKSEDIVKAYIERIKVVNPILNAVVEDRFSDALEEAQAVDRFLGCSTDLELIKSTQPLLGVPLTVKESCRLEGMSLSVGSKPRFGMKATTDGEAVMLLKKAGAIPLLVSNTPEFCLYWESNNLITGCTNNPYETSRSAAGSSGGEGALLGSGASVIGIGSDLAGSIRLPALFNGVFGHKPTPGVISNEGHFPTSTNQQIQFCLVLGPMTRYAEDLPLMLRIMGGSNTEKLGLDENVKISSINVFHMKEFGKSLAFAPVNGEIKGLIDKAVKHLQEQSNCIVTRKSFDMENSLEATSAILFAQDDIPQILGSGKTRDNLTLEVTKSIFGSSKYSKNGLVFTFLNAANGFVPKRRREFYEKNISELRQSFLDSLSDNGVFLYPTFHSSAYQHHKLLFELSGVLYCSIFNLLGFPCTHVPMGLDSDGLPIGIQVVAAPFQDKLCFAIAKELERAFGGWIPPS